MDRIDFLAAGVLREDAGADMKTARDVYVKMRPQRRAFYRARVSLKFNTAIR